MKSNVLKATISSMLLLFPLAASAGSYIVLGKVGSNLSESVVSAGGTVTKSLSALNAVVAEGDDNFKDAIAQSAGVQGVAPNLVVQWIPAVEQTPEMEVLESEMASPPFSGDDDKYFDLRWGHTAINAIGAWDMGQRGNGAVVAVLDGGFDLDHPDLAPNIDMTCSANMVESESLSYALLNTFSHGTHVAGTVAAADNGFGVIGVAPQAKLCLVKVLRDIGNGSFEDVAEGIVYAADQGVDIISMSLGAALLKSGLRTGNPNYDYTALDANTLRIFIERAVNYAYKQGVIVITSAGNDAIDGDADTSLIHIPSDSPNAVSISATAPIGWAIDPNTSLDNSASYTNYGRSVINLAAPGGDRVYPGNENCVIVGVARACWVFDLVFSTGNGGWYWSSGTSMATPHASGVAALIVGRYGKLNPAQLRSKLESGADDLGQPGKDPVYGSGRVNAFESVK